MEYLLKCTKCGRVEDEGRFRCGVCKSILEVSYIYPKKLKFGNAGGKGISKYANLLPVAGKLFSLGEGGSELRKSRHAPRRCNLLLKIETENPTHTFKDRGSAVEVTKAKELGYGHVCCASTGNMGYSLAHYARKAGLKATIFISSAGNKKKIAKIIGEKAALVKVKGDFNASLRAAEAFGRRGDVLICGDYHYRKEGQKTVGFEILEQLKFKVPDFIFIPIGNGTLFSGIYKGLAELKMCGKIRSMPRLIAVQSAMCDPLVKAFKYGKKVQYVAPKTEADAIAVGFPTFGFECLKALKETKGRAIGVSESELESAISYLGRQGVYAELGGAAAMAGFMHESKRRPKAFYGKTAVVVVSGNNEGRAKPGK
jgi:threonine synthase